MCRKGNRRGVEGNRYLRDALGDLAERVEITPLLNDESTRSPINNSLWDVLARQAQVAYPGAALQPGISVGFTDARFFRRKGTVAYGATLLSPDMTPETFGDRFHGDDERIDVASLSLSTDLWLGVAQTLLG